MIFHLCAFAVCNQTFFITLSQDQSEYIGIIAFCYYNMGMHVILFKKLQFEMYQTWFQTTIGRKILITIFPKFGAFMPIVKFVEAMFPAKFVVDHL